MDTLSISMSQVKAPSYNKYDSLRSTKPVTKAEKSLTWTEMLLGPYETKPSDFKRKVDSFLAKQERRSYKLGQAASKTLDSVDGNMWTGEVYMGSGQEKVDLIFDTSSDWVAVEGSNCATCEAETYDPSTSTSAKKIGTELSTRTYGIAKFTGSEWTDDICVTRQACIRDFEYFLA